MLAARNLYSAVFFTAMLIITKNLYCTCVATSTTSLILCLIINSQMTRKYVGHEEDGRKLQMSHVWELLRTCTPMFIGTFLSLLLYNIPKYAMAGVMTDEYQTYYSILFMPSFVISLMCEFVFKPTITTIAELWWENNVKKVHTVHTADHWHHPGLLCSCCGRRASHRSNIAGDYLRRGSFPI